MSQHTEPKSAPEPPINHDETTLTKEFQGTANNFKAWFYTAETLWAAARAVRKSDDEKGGDKLLHDFGEMTRTRDVYAMLIGYAVECALKGLYVKAGNEIAGATGGLHPIPGFKSHNLRMTGSPSFSLKSTA